MWRELAEVIFYIIWAVLQGVFQLLVSAEGLAALAVLMIGIFLFGCPLFWQARGLRIKTQAIYALIFCLCFALLSFVLHHFLTVHWALKLLPKVWFGFFVAGFLIAFYQYISQQKIALNKLCRAISRQILKLTRLFNNAIKRRLFGARIFVKQAFHNIQLGGGSLLRRFHHHPQNAFRTRRRSKRA